MKNAQIITGHRLAAFWTSLLLAKSLSCATGRKAGIERQRSIG